MNAPSNAPSNAQPMLQAKHATNATYATDERNQDQGEKPLVPDAAKAVDNREIDPLSEFLEGLTAADVEAERLAPLSKARRESFGHQAHRVMLQVHELNRAEFRRHQIGIALKAMNNRKAS